MILEELRNLLAAQPFKSFSIFTGDGREVAVPHHDYAWVQPTGGTVYVQQLNGKIDFINISQITRLNSDVEAPSEPSGSVPRG